MSGNIYRYTLTVESNNYETMIALATLAREVGETEWRCMDDEEYDALTTETNGDQVGRQPLSH